MSDCQLKLKGTDQLAGVHSVHRHPDVRLLPNCKNQQTEKPSYGDVYLDKGGDIGTETSVLRLGATSWFNKWTDILKEKFLSVCKLHCAVVYALKGLLINTFLKKSTQDLKPSSKKRIFPSWQPLCRSHYNLASQQTRGITFAVWFVVGCPFGNPTSPSQALTHS